MSKREFFLVAEVIITITLGLFVYFFKIDIDPYAGKTLKDGILYTIIDDILYVLMYLFGFALIFIFYLIFESKSKIKMVIYIFALYLAIVSCEALRLPLLKFPEEIVDTLKIYPYYGVALLVWSSVFIIIDYFVNKKEATNEEKNR